MTKRDTKKNPFSPIHETQDNSAFVEMDDVVGESLPMQIETLESTLPSTSSVFDESTPRIPSRTET